MINDRVLNRFYYCVSRTTIFLGGQMGVIWIGCGEYHGLYRRSEVNVIFVLRGEKLQYLERANNDTKILFTFI